MKQHQGIPLRKTSVSLSCFTYTWSSICITVFSCVLVRSAEW